MKKLSLLLVGLLFVPTLFLTSCDDGDDPIVVEPAFSILKTYMVESGNDIPNIIGDKTAGTFFAKPAPATGDLGAFLSKYHIVDIRNESDFLNGHIEGAKRIDVANILAEGDQDKPVLVVCYTGQTACYATALMRLYGHKDTFALKWGMSGWNSSTASKWNGKIGSEAAKTSSNWSYGNPPANSVFDDPAFASLKTDGKDLLEERVKQVLAAGFGSVMVGSDVLENPTSYFINNFFPEAHYTGFGHIDSAYRIQPVTLAGNQYMNLDSGQNAKVVTYCYTGQTSAIMTACLRVLGYDAYTLGYGMNGLYNTNPFWSDPAIKNQWGADSNSKDLPLVQ